MQLCFNWNLAGAYDTQNDVIQDGDFLCFSVYLCLIGFFLAIMTEELKSGGVCGWCEALFCMCGFQVQIYNYTWNLLEETQLQTQTWQLMSVHLENKLWTDREGQIKWEKINITCDFIIIIVIIINLYLNKKK